MTAFPDLAPDAAADLALIGAAAIDAARLARDMQTLDVEAWSKGDGSPVSKADIAADDLLRDRLTRARPDYGWLSEETKDDRTRLDRMRTFVVDPIDGTRGYLAGGDDWCVCVAVVEAGRPILAAVEAPSRGESYRAARGRGAWMNGTRLAIMPRASLEGARLAGTKRAVERLGDLKADIVSHVPSLALRLALVASGALDAAVAHRGAKDWDLAAAELLVTEAGGLVRGAHDEGLVYNRADVRHPAVVACGMDPGGMDLSEALRDKLRTLTG